MLLQMALSHSFSWLSRSPPHLLYPRVYPSSTVSSSVGFSGSILPSIPASPMFLPLNQLDPRCRIGRCLPFHPVSNQSIHSVSVPFKGLDAAPPSVFLSCFLGVTLSLHTCAVGKGSWPASWHLERPVTLWPSLCSRRTNSSACHWLPSIPWAPGKLYLLQQTRRAPR